MGDDVFNDDDDDNGCIPINSLINDFQLDCKYYFLDEFSSIYDNQTDNFSIEF